METTLAMTSPTDTDAREGFQALLQAAGWRAVQHWQDERGWFGVFFARA